MAYTEPTVDDFKEKFARDFPFGSTDTTVMDDDVQRAITDASTEINEDLYETQAQFTNGFLLLSAHFLVMNLRASSQGLAGSFNWLTGSKGVGSVSESFVIPDAIQNNPYLAMLSKTSYGAQYLMRIIPQLAGPFGSVAGGTHA